MIDTSTAEILASVQGHGEESRCGTGILGAGGSSSGWGGGALDMKSSNFANTILGAAVNKATTDVAHGLDQKAASLPTAPVKVVKIDGVVADVSPDGTLIINVGSKDGVKVGDTLAVNRKVREVKDPTSGKVHPQRGGCRGHPQDHRSGRGLRGGQVHRRRPGESRRRRGQREIGES